MLLTTLTRTSGRTVHQEMQQGVTAGDLASLIAALTEASLPEELINELPSAIEQDEPIRTDGLGPNVSKWIAKVVRGGWRVIRLPDSQPSYSCSITESVAPNQAPVV